MHLFERIFRRFIAIVILWPISLTIFSIHFLFIGIFFNVVAIIYLVIIDIFNVISSSLNGSGQYDPRGLGVSIRSLLNDSTRFSLNALSIPKRFVDINANQGHTGSGLGIPLDTIRRFKVPAIICTVIIVIYLIFTIRIWYRSNYYSYSWPNTSTTSQKYPSTSHNLTLDWSDGTTILNEKNTNDSKGSIVIWSRKPIRHKTKVLIDNKVVGYLSKHSENDQDCDSKVAVKKRVLSGYHDVVIHQFSTLNQKWYKTATRKAFVEKGKCEITPIKFGHIPNEPEY